MATEYLLKCRTCALSMEYSYVDGYKQVLEVSDNFDALKSILMMLKNNNFPAFLRLESDDRGFTLHVLYFMIEHENHDVVVIDEYRSEWTIQQAHEDWTRQRNLFTPPQVEN